MFKWFEMSTIEFIFSNEYLKIIMKIKLMGLWTLVLCCDLGLSACSPADSAPVTIDLAPSCVQAGGMVGLWLDRDGRARQMCKSPGGHVCDDWSIRRGQCGR
ncbi:MAG: DUF333 domain-containing protein [Betaproteobacteria bacterium]|nr:DUF333 domain-containing protein [Betaproteobacteria bacterium]NBY06176.1 DUF333 domain-containing protein [Betaproteobacteria bacterium]